jgi:hypothetical protein
MVFITVALSHYKDMEPLYSTTSHNEVHLSNLLVAEGLLLFMTIMSAVVLVMAEIFVSSQHNRRCRAWYRVLTVLVAATGMLLILADTVLVVVTNKSNMVLAVILAPVMVLVTVLTSAGAWIGDQPSSTLGISLPPGSMYDSAMKGTSDIAMAGTIASFTLQGTVIFGYLKTPGGNQGKQDPPLDLAACYTTSTVSLIVMMVCAMPLRLLPNGMLDILVMLVEKLRHAMLVALAMMALVVSVEFLDGFVVLSFFSEAVAILLYYAVKFFTACQPHQENTPHDSIFRMVTTGGFTLMTGLYAAFVGIDHYDFYLKTAIFLLLVAVLSSLSRLAIPLHIHEMGGTVEICIASLALAFPLLAFLVACPLVIKVFLNLYLNR